MTESAYLLSIIAPISSAISYGIELAVTVFAILKDELQRIGTHKKDNVSDHS